MMKLVRDTKCDLDVDCHIRATTQFMLLDLWISLDICANNSPENKYFHSLRLETFKLNHLGEKSQKYVVLKFEDLPKKQRPLTQFKCILMVSSDEFTLCFGDMAYVFHYNKSSSLIEFEKHFRAPKEIKRVRKITGLYFDLILVLFVDETLGMITKGEREFKMISNESAVQNRKIIDELYIQKYCDKPAINVNGVWLLLDFIDLKIREVKNLVIRDYLKMRSFWEGCIFQGVKDNKPYEVFVKYQMMDYFKLSVNFNSFIIVKFNEADILLEFQDIGNLTGKKFKKFYVYSLIVGLCDGYFRTRKEMTGKEKLINRFLKIATTLPLVLQEQLIQSLYPTETEFISSKEFSGFFALYGVSIYDIYPLFK